MMSDINRLIIENFQSHKHTVIEFVNGLNVITGPSDQGKSAILRALKWVLYNEPRGMEFIRHGATTARVAVKMSNGYEIIRERSKNKNKYTVISPDGESQSFEGFGNEVPEEVIKAHGIPKVVLDKDQKSSLNIADQLESPFLLSETGAVRAKAIGRMTGVHIIDNALRECMVDIRRESQARDRIRNQLDEIDVEIQTFDYLETVKEKLLTTEKMIKEIKWLIERKELIEKIKNRYADTVSELDRIRDILMNLDNIEPCEAVVSKCNDLYQKLSSVIRLKQSFQKTESSIRESAEVLENTVSLDKVGELLSELEDRNTRKNILKNLAVSMGELERELAKCHRMMDLTKDADSVDALMKESSLKIQRMLQLRELKEKLSSIGRDIQKGHMYLSSMENIDQVEQYVSKIEKDISALERLSETKRNYDSISNFISDGVKYLEDNRKQTDQLIEKYLGHLKKLGRCPLCGSKIGDQQIRDIVKHYEEVR